MAYPRVSLRTIAWEAGHFVGVPFWVLWGMVGNETGYGTDITTSSANAWGVAQFTAEHKPGARTPYPMVNSRAAAILAQQMVAAAEYLKYLEHVSGSWTGALDDYFGAPNVPTEGYPSYSAAAVAHSRYTGSGLVVESLYANPVAAFLKAPAPSSAPSAVGVTGSAQASTSGNPRSHGEKVVHTGRRMGQTGSQLVKARQQLQALARTHPPLRLPPRRR